MYSHMHSNGARWQVCDTYMSTYMPVFAHAHSSAHAYIHARTRIYAHAARARAHAHTHTRTHLRVYPMGVIGISKQIC